LFQIKNSQCRGLIGENWIKGSTLELDCELEAEWDRFTQNLTGAGIHLQERPNSLIWTGGDNTGKFSVKNVYLAIADKIWKKQDEAWRKKLWKWDCPMKIKLFIWLLTENKILVWENLQTRGWAGPNRCILCKLDCETVLHIFVHCKFTRAVWFQVAHALNLPENWTGTSVSHCFNTWHSTYKSYPTLPAILCWNIWTVRNATIFEERPPSTLRVVNNILAAVATLGFQAKDPPTRRIKVNLPTDRVIAWFDGAAQQGGNLCGAGGKSS
jgi:hypothetical protein